MKLKYLPVIFFIVLIASFIYSQVQMSGGSTTANYTVTNQPDGYWLEDSLSKLIIKDGTTYRLLGMSSSGHKAWLRADSGHIAADAIRSYHIENGTIEDEDIGVGQIDPETKLDPSGGSVGEALVINNGPVVRWGQIDSVGLATGAVRNTHIANGAVTWQKIADSTLAPVNVASNTFSFLPIDPSVFGLGLERETIDPTTAGIKTLVDGNYITNTNDTITLAKVDSGVITDGSVGYPDIAFKDSFQCNIDESFYPSYPNTSAIGDSVAVVDTVILTAGRYAPFRRITGSKEDDFAEYNLYFMYTPRSHFRTWLYGGDPSTLVSMEFRCSTTAVGEAFFNRYVYTLTGSLLFSESSQTVGTIDTWESWVLDSDDFNSSSFPLLFRVRVRLVAGETFDMGRFRFRYKGE